MLRSPSIGAILSLGLALTVIFIFWQFIAYGIYELTLGPQLPDSIGHFAYDVFMTSPGRQLIILGVGVGFVFAAIVLVISSVAFPLLLDREVGLEVAIRTSVRAALVNPGPMALMGDYYRCWPGYRVAALACWSHYHPTGARARDLAPVSQDGGATVTSICPK